MGLDDVEIVRRVLAGEPELFDILVIRYQRLVRFKVSRHLKEPADIEEATQRTFVSAYKDLATFNPGWKPARKQKRVRKPRKRRKPFRPWLMGIAYNRAMDILREQKAQPEPIGEDDGTDDQETGEVPDSGESQDPAAIHVKNMQKERLWQALESLPRLERDCVILHCMEGRSFPETARQLGCSESQAKRAVHRGLKKLRRLDKRFHFSG